MFPIPNGLMGARHTHLAKRWLLPLGALAALLFSLAVHAEEPSLVGTWQGGYACGSVNGDMTLSLEEGSNGLIEGEFHFQIKGRASAEGVYRVRGRYQPDKRAFNLVPAEWIDRPSGYRAVGLSGEMRENGLTISGEFHGCNGQFEAQRGGAATTGAGTLVVTPDTLTEPDGGPFGGHWSGVIQCKRSGRRLPDMALEIDAIQNGTGVAAITRLQAPDPYGLKRQIWQGTVDGGTATLTRRVRGLEGAWYYTAKTAHFTGAGDGRLKVELDGVTGKNCDEVVLRRSGPAAVPADSALTGLAGSWTGYFLSVGRERLDSVDPLFEISQGRSSQVRIEIASDGRQTYGLFSAASPVNSPPAEQDRLTALIQPLLTMDDGSIAFVATGVPRAEGYFSPDKGYDANNVFMFRMHPEPDGTLLVIQSGSGRSRGAPAYRLHRPSEEEAAALAIGEGPPAPLPSTIGGTFGTAPSLDAQCHALADWFEPVASANDLPHMMVSAGEEATLPLFMDSVFEPVFGLPYALTTAEERKAVLQLSQSVCGRRIGKEFMRSIGYGFDQQRDFDEIVGKLIDRQDSAAWHETAMAEIDALPVASGSLKRIRAIEDEAKQRDKEISPEGHEALDAKIAAKREAIAVVSINNRVADLASLPDALPTLDVLDKLVKDAGEVKLPSADRRTLDANVRAKADAITRPVIDAALTSAQSVPETLAGLAEITKLERETKRLIGNLAADLRPSDAGSRLQAIHARREALIANPDIQQSFVEAMQAVTPGGDPEERVISEAGTYLDRAQYRGSNAIPVYADAVNRAIASLQIRSIQFADKSASHVDGEPSAENMLFAVKAKFDQINEELSSTFGRCQRREFQNDPLMAVECLAVLAAGGGGELKVRITRFEKLGCAEEQNRSGYICDYILGFESDSPFMQGRMGELMGAGSVSQGRFLRLPAGWLFTRLH